MSKSRLDGLTFSRRLRSAGVPVAGALMLACMSAANAQEVNAGAPTKRAVTIQPRVSVSETFTNNVRLDSVGQQSDQITEISPGIRVSIEGARLKSYFDYSLSKVLYAQNSSPSQNRNALTTFGTVEAIDNWAFLDFSGSISQQAISAFGQQALDNASINTNRTEVSSYRLSPYIRGAIGRSANYEARFSRTLTSSDSATSSDVTADDVAIKVTDGSAFGRLGWSADITQQNVGYSAGRDTRAGRLNVGLSYAITPQLSLLGNVGHESNNYSSVNTRGYSNSGMGVIWTPSKTTKLSANRDSRSFGSSHNLSFEHRTARTAWRFTDSKGVSNTPNQTGIASLGSVYDLLFSQFASLESEPIARAQLVNAYLQNNGINPNAVVSSSFLTSALSLQRRQDVSFALLGVRDTITFFASRSESTRLDTLSTGVDDFNTSSLVKQRGLSVNYTHRLTPDYSLGVLASHQTSSGSAVGQDTTVESIYVNLTGKVSKKAAATVGVRRAVSSGGAKPYSETAVTGNLNVQF